MTNAVLEAPARQGITLSQAELQEITGYRQPAAQLTELKRQGFHRARRNALGAVVLEREHYAAVCAGRDGMAAANDTPLLRSQRRRA